MSRRTPSADRRALPPDAPAPGAPPRTGALACLATALCVLAAAGCAYFSVRPAGGAFDEAAGGGGDRIRYTARCLACQVTFQSPDGVESEDVEGSWDRSFWLDQVPAPTLSVCRADRDTHLQGEISIAGDRVAADEIEWATANTRSCVTLSAQARAEAAVRTGHPQSTRRRP